MVFRWTLACQSGFVLKRDKRRDDHNDDDGERKGWVMFFSHFPFYLGSCSLSSLLAVFSDDE